MRRRFAHDPGVRGKGESAGIDGGISSNMATEHSSTSHTHSVQPLHGPEGIHGIDLRQYFPLNRHLHGSHQRHLPDRSSRLKCSPLNLSCFH